MYPALIPLQYPNGEGQETAVEFAIDSTKFHEVFAADLSVEQTALMAATQRPLSELALRRRPWSGSGNAPTKPEPAGPLSQARPEVSTLTLFTRVRGRVVLRSSAREEGPGSCKTPAPSRCAR